MKTIKTIAICLLLTNNVTLFAQTKTFTRDYTYQASEIDSKVSSRTNATAEMRNMLLREAGAYIRTEQQLVVTGSSQEYAEKIEAITAGIVEMTVLDERWNGETYWIKAEMVINPKEVEQKIKEIAEDRKQLQELENSRTRAKAAEEEAARLRAEVAQLRKEKASEEQIETKIDDYNRQIEKLDIEELLTKANHAYNYKKYEQAVEYYKQVIKLNPGFITAYTAMSNAYDKLNKYELEIEIIKKALSAKPDTTTYDRRETITISISKEGKRISETVKVEYISPFPVLNNNLGYAYYNLKDYELAIAYYKKSLDLKPDDENAAITLWNLGDACTAAGEYEQAIAAYEKYLAIEPNHNIEYKVENLKEIIAYQKAVSINSNDAEAYYNLGQAYYMTNIYQQAIASYQKAISIKPDYVEAYRMLGYVQGIMIEDYNQAIAVYNKAISIKPDYMQLYDDLGFLYHNRMKDYNQAIATYEKAISIKPDYAEAYNNLGEVYISMKDYNQAIAVYKKSATLDLDCQGYAYAMMGDIYYYHIKNYEQAISAYEQAINTVNMQRCNRGLTYGSYTSLGDAYYQTDNYEKSMAIYEQDGTQNSDEKVESLKKIILYKKAIDSNPNDAQAHSNLGVAYNGMGDRERAMASCKKAIALKPDFAEAYSNLGDVYCAMDEPKQAKAQYEKAISIKPDCAQAYYGLGSLSEDLEQQIAYYKKAVAFKPDYAEAYHGLGRVYQRVNNFEQAIENYKKAISITPDDCYIYYNLGVAYNIIGNREQALTNLGKSTYLGCPGFYADAYMANVMGVSMDEINHYINYGTE